MKQLIILLLIIIALIIGIGKYQQYQRYNSPKVNYKTDKKLDFEYHNQEVVINYYKVIEDLNSYIMMQWSANEIDVRTPEDDNEETKLAVIKYSEKLAIIAYYETKLEKSLNLKANGLNNSEIKYLENIGTDLASYNKLLVNNKIKTMFKSNQKINYNQKSTLIFEVQKRLIANGYKITLDGVYKEETLNAIKVFEEKNNLFADGILDVLTLDAIFS
jgi:hypothetical protein